MIHVVVPWEQTWSHVAKCVGADVARVTAWAIVGGMVVAGLKQLSGVRQSGVLQPASLLQVSWLLVHLLVCWRPALTSLAALTQLTSLHLQMTNMQLEEMQCLTFWCLKYDMSTYACPCRGYNMVHCVIPWP